MDEAGFIAVAWGGPAFRAWLLTSTGDVIDTRSSEDGLRSVPADGHAAVLKANCAAWLDADPGLPILLSGMVGSRTGWVEAPYAACPLGPDELVAAARHLDLDTHRATFLPGAVCADAAGDLDVMRGEELQILGAAALSGLAEAVVSIPGTHSKLARLEGGRLAGFRTFVTGEIFGLLRGHSLVGALADSDAFDETAFADGVHRGSREPLSHAVFAARANALNGRLAPTSVSSFLSGILIGAELADVAGDDGPPLLLLASGPHAERYQAACRVLGRTCRHLDARDTALAGFGLVGSRLLARGRSG